MSRFFQLFGLGFNILIVVSATIMFSKGEGNLFAYFMLYGATVGIVMITAFLTKSPKQ